MRTHRAAVTLTWKVEPTKLKIRSGKLRRSLLATASQSGAWSGEGRSKCRLKGMKRYIRNRCSRIYATFNSQCCGIITSLRPYRAWRTSVLILASHFSDCMHLSSTRTTTRLSSWGIKEEYWVNVKTPSPRNVTNHQWCYQLVSGIKSV